MKKLSLILIVLLFGVVASTSAQVPGVPSKPFNLYLDAGLNSTSAPDAFKDYHKLGYHTEGGIGFKAFPFIQVVGKVGFYTIAKDWNFIQGLSDILDGGNVKIMTFGLDARASIGAPAVPIKPFALVGVGLAKISEDDITTTIGDVSDHYTGGLADQTKFYYNIGGGLEFGGGLFSFFIQARYVSIATEGESIKYIPVSLGIKF